MKAQLLLTLGAAVLVGTPAYAIYEDITIADTVVGVGNSWWVRSDENNEVEPGCVTGQQWDLEAFWVDKSNNKLKIQAGFNMWNGLNDTYWGQTWYSGDIFIDVDGDANWGDNTPEGHTGNQWETVNNSDFKWDYVIVFDREGSQQAGGVLTGGYKVFSISDPSVDLEVWFGANYKSNPFRYVSGGTEIASGSGLQQTGSGSEGDPYLLGEIDLRFLRGAGQGTWTFHFTVGCGNDLLMGQTPSWSIPDGGLTVALLGIGLSALGCVSSRTRKKD